MKNTVNLNSVNLVNDDSLSYIKTLPVHGGGKTKKACVVFPRLLSGFCLQSTIRDR